MIEKNRTEPDTNTYSNRDIAIIGVSGELPLAKNLDQYWENLINKVECIRQLPKAREEQIKNYIDFINAGQDKCDYSEMAYLENIDQFDASEFKLTPKEAQLMDPHQRLLLENTWELLQDAGYSEDEVRGKNIGVYIGASNFGGLTYFDFLKEADPESMDLGVSGNLQSILPSRISYYFDFKGPAMVIDTACSSSLVAVTAACQALRDEVCEMAVAGSIRLHIFPVKNRYRIGFESKNGRTKAFDNNSSGTGTGEGVVSIMLKPLKNALRDGNHIYGVIKGFAINQDGTSMGITAPNAEAQAEVLKSAWRDANIDPEELSYLEAHGTGTLLGDPLEIDGMTKAFRSFTDKRQFCAVGSVKNNLGHLYEASGLASIIKCIYSLQNHKLAPTINMEKPNNMIDFINSPVYVNDELRAWDGINGKRLCGVSSFGFSGTNCHIVIEEFEEKVLQRVFPSLLFFSGKSDKALYQYVKNFLTGYEKIAENDVRDIIYTMLVGRKHYSHRLVLRFKHYEDLKDKLDKVITHPGEYDAADGIYYGVVDDAEKEIITLEALKQCNLNAPVQDVITERSLVEAYLSGQTVCWKELFWQEKRKRVEIPVNVLTDKSCWLNTDRISGEHRTALVNADAPFKEQMKLNMEGRQDHQYTDTERKLSEIIGRLMGYDVININKNFYELGGDSLLITKLYTEIKNIFQVEMDIASLFSYPSVYSLADYIDKIIKQQEFKECRTGEPFGAGSEDIAIIGMAGRFPLAEDIDEFWDNVCHGRNCIRDIPENRKEDLKSYIEHLGYKEKEYSYSKAGYMSDISSFDYEYFGITKEEAELMDPNQRVLLETVFTMLEKAGYGSNKIVNTQTGVFIGYTEEFAYSYRKFICDSDIKLVKKALAGNLNSVLAGRISYALDLKGPSVVIDTACSSSLVAVNMAVESLQAGKCEKAIVGSVHLKLIPLELPEGNIGIESPSSVVRAFDDAADGTVEGEAVCAILLKPLEQAVADGDNIRGIIKGCAVNQDGTSMGIMAPRSETQAQVILKACEQAKVNPETITYIETHGTGTRLGDPVEIDGLKKAFEKYTDKKQFCAITSLKPNIGHLYQAAGLAGIIKAVMAMENRLFPPAINLNRPNRLIPFESSPFYINDKLREWKTNGEPRRCGVSSFGLSGTNCHIVLEEYIKRPRETHSSKELHLFLLSSVNEERLNQLINQYYEVISAHKDYDITDLCYTMCARREHRKVRIALLVKDKEELLDKLRYLQKEDWKSSCPKDVFYRNADKNEMLFCDKLGFADLLEQVKTKKPSGSRLGRERRDLLEEICFRFISGYDMDWGEWEQEGVTVDLPSNLFDSKKCWYIPRPNRLMAQTEVEAEAAVCSTQEKESTDIVHEEWMEELSATERAICCTFKNTLQIKQLNRDSNFFVCGGDSVSAAKFAAELYNETGAMVPISDIFLYPVLESFLQYVVNSGLLEAAPSAERILPLEERELYELSYMQEELWLSTQVNHDSSALNIVAAAILRNFDPDILYKALYQVLKRHKITRARFVVRDGKPFEYIEETENVMKNFIITDLSYLKNSWEAGNQKINEDTIREFNLLEDVLVRMNLFKMNQSEYIFEFNIHHIISDWISVNILMKEMLYYYRCYIRQEEPGLEELQFQYYDFAVWHKNIVISSKAELEGYWNETLSGTLPVLELNTDKKRPAVKSQVGRRIDTLLDTRQIQALKGYAENQHGTLYMMLLSLVYLLLHKNSGQEEIMIGINTAGRENPQLSNQVGYYINMLPIRIRAKDNNRFSELFEAVKAQVIGAFAHQEYPFVLMLKHPSVHKDRSRSPVFDVVVQLIYEEEEAMLPDSQNRCVIIDGKAQIEEYQYASQESKYDLVFNFYEKAGQITLQMDYSTDLFTEETAYQITEYYKNILAQVTDQYDLTLLEVKDQRLSDLYDTYNKTEELLHQETLQGMFHNSVLKYPENPALRIGEKVLTYRQLNEASDKVAVFLRENHISQGCYVPLLAEREMESVINILGILKTGAAYVPVNAEYPEERIRYICEEIGTKLLLDASLCQRILQRRESSREYEVMNIYDNINAPAYVIYTSGSTGMPKGVEILQKAAGNTIQDINKRFGVGEADRLIGLSSISFDLSVYDIFGALQAGAELVMVRDQRNMKEVTKLLLDHSITVWNSVPMIASMLMEYLKASQLKLVNNMRVKLFLLSGDWIPVSLPGIIRSYWKEQCEIISLGGATEASIWSIFYPIREVSRECMSIPYGYPLANQTWYVLDHNLNLCPIGIRGELYIGGEGLAQGYFHDKEKTEEAFCQHKKYGRLYKTGDLGLMNSSGYIEFLGREDTQVKINGYRMEISEVEYVLKKNHQVKDAAVTVYTDDTGSRTLCAYLVAEIPLNMADIKDGLRKELPVYMIPVHYMQIENIPLTANCKLDKKALPSPNLEQIILEAPATEIEMMMTSIWKEVLNKETIGINQNFFELGGDSITALKIELEMEKRGYLTYDKIASSIFKYPTIKELAFIYKELSATETA